MVLFKPAQIGERLEIGNSEGKACMLFWYIDLD